MVGLMFRQNLLLAAILLGCLGSCGGGTGEKNCTGDSDCMRFEEGRTVRGVCEECGSLDECFSRCVYD